ncbi:hypothetical protein [Cupriavidus necator]
MRLSSITLANLTRLAAHLYGGQRANRTRIAFNGSTPPGTLSSYGQYTDNLDSSSTSYPTIELADTRTPTSSFPHDDAGQGSDSDNVALRNKDAIRSTTATYKSDASGSPSVDAAFKLGGELDQHIPIKRSPIDNISPDNSITAEPSSTKTKFWEKYLSDKQKEYLNKTEFEPKEELRKAIIGDLYGDTNSDPEKAFNDMLNAYDWANRNYHDLEVAFNSLLSGWNSTRNTVDRLSKTHEELREPIKTAAATWFENRHPSHSGVLIGPEAPSDKDLLDAAGRISKDRKQKEQRISDIHHFYSTGSGIRGIYGYDFDQSNVHNLGSGTVIFNNLDDALRFGPRGTEEPYLHEFNYSPPRWFAEPNELRFRVKYDENSINKDASIKEIQYAVKKWYSLYEDIRTVMLGPERYSTDKGETWQWYGVHTSDAEEALKRRMLDEIMNEARIEAPYNLPPIDFGTRKRDISDIQHENTDYTPMQQGQVSGPSKQETMDADRFPFPQPMNRQEDAAQLVTNQGLGQVDSPLYNLQGMPNVQNRPETLQSQSILQDRPKNSQISMQEPDRSPSVILQNQPQNSQMQSQLPRDNEQHVMADPRIMQGNNPPYAVQQVSYIHNQQAVAPSQASELVVCVKRIASYSALPGHA